MHEWFLIWFDCKDLFSSGLYLVFWMFLFIRIYVVNHKKHEYGLKDRKVFLPLKRDLQQRDFFAAKAGRHQEIFFATKARRHKVFFTTEDTKKTRSSRRNLIFSSWILCALSGEKSHAENAELRREKLIFVSFCLCVWIPCVFVPLRWIISRGERGGSQRKIILCVFLSLCLNPLRLRFFVVKNLTRRTRSFAEKNYPLCLSVFVFEFLSVPWQWKAPLAPVEDWFENLLFLPKKRWQQ